jgi:polysaccharide biosynthesis protein PelF
LARPCILLTTEGTYPFAKGGVSTWCHVLTQQLPEIDFKLLAVTANPYQEIRYELTPNVLEVFKIPLWGMDDPVEYSWRSPFSSALKSKQEVTPKLIKTSFLPLWESFLRTIFCLEVEPKSFGELILSLHEYFLVYDYHKTMNSPLVWSAFKHLAWDYCQQEALTEVKLNEITEAMRLLYRFLITIHLPVPRADLTHSSAAAFCGLPGIIAKLQWGTPYLLTEHGINIREQYLNLNQNIPSFFIRKFLYRLMGAIVKVNFYYADLVSPVCEFNARWERWWGVAPEKIKVIYNGADPEKFHPTPPIKKERPQVMNMGLIFPLKGQLDLIKASIIVREQIPNVEFIFYGKASDENYFAQCEALVKEHNLETTINFAGFTSEPWRVYSEADVVAMSSISEGFPFAIIEAMLSGATIVSTDVGGVHEALADTGLLVRASRPEQMAAAILKLLLLSDEERSQYGKKALSRSLKLFTQETFLTEHRKIYRQLLVKNS